MHVRDERNANTGDPAVYGELVRTVRSKSNALIQIGGALGPRRDPDTGEIGYPFTEADRLAALETKPEPDMFTVKIGAVELQVPANRYETVGLRNSPAFLRQAIPSIINRKLCLELEIFDLGCLYNAKKLENEGLSTLTIRDGLLLGLFEGLVERSGAQGLLWMVSFQSRAASGRHRWTLGSCLTRASAF